MGSNQVLSSFGDSVNPLVSRANGHEKHLPAFRSAAQTNMQHAEETLGSCSHALAVSKSHSGHFFFKW